MNLKICFFLVVLFTIPKSYCFGQINESKQPNIIVILIDDAGYADFGFMGCKDLQTPNIDNLAKNGIVFTDAHVSASVCAPSRAGMLTGRYQQRFGFEANGTGNKESGEIGLPNGVPTLANVFKNNHYRTIALGKWHLGYNEDDHPNERGFDDFYGFLSGSRSYFPIDNPTEKNMLQHNGVRQKFKGYLTDVLTNKALTYIEENKYEPFFMYLAYNAVHTPMEAKPEHLKMFQNHPRQKLAAMTWSLDENIGKLIAKLETTKQLENTLIFFLSDNGGATTNQSNNGILKGFKGNKYEGGHRVPFVVSWKNKIKENISFDGLTSSLDIFTTAIAAASINSNLELDGVNLLPYLKGNKKGDPHKKLFWRKLNTAAVRIGNEKLIRLDSFGSRMYNLKNDLGETFDLSKLAPKTYDDLTDELEAWESGLMDPLWDEGFWMNINYRIHKNLMLNKFKDVKGMKDFNKKR
ncbi:sulfatase-like hydrolase/transferase [Snuella sedimenti]|uniref:Sulfatase-like hydrolase/transferase n=1 Tax=Snuella sedimenti TaxID=2798802 RepID=A0A8J7LN13_9FLAO|nr:sulfatase-like hydrolase/transferase [Snuella sedimenti]MBJ6367318.1 sulfatase-like hydrolase/transferase [Snuella sedimenti]